MDVVRSKLVEEDGPTELSVVEILDATTDMQCNCLMGLFAEIKRAWLSIDSDIFVWNYEDG